MDSCKRSLYILASEIEFYKHHHISTVSLQAMNVIRYISIIQKDNVAEKGLLWSSFFLGFLMTDDFHKKRFSLWHKQSLLMSNQIRKCKSDD